MEAPPIHSAGDRELGCVFTGLQADGISCRTVTNWDATVGVGLLGQCVQLVISAYGNLIYHASIGGSKYGAEQDM